MKQIMLFGLLVLALGLFSSQVNQEKREPADQQCMPITVITLDSDLAEPIPLNPGIFGTRLCAMLVETKQVNESGSLTDSQNRIYEIKPGNNPIWQKKNSHIIEFYEFADGEIGVHESKPADDGLPLLTDSFQDKTMAEIFQMLCPEKLVPQALIEADERAACAKTQVSTSGSKESEDFKPLSPFVTTQAVNCSPDYYRDGWGGGWFINLIWGKLGNCPRSDAGTNRGNINWYTPWSVIWLDWNTMNGDFWYSQLSEGYARKCFISCWWSRRWSYWLQPRYLDNWRVWGGDWWFHSYNNCGHAHFATGYDI